MICTVVPFTRKVFIGYPFRSFVPPTGMPKGFKPGDRVRFRFHLDKDGMAVLSSVEPAKGDMGGQGGKP